MAITLLVVAGLVACGGEPSPERSGASMQPVSPEKFTRAGDEICDRFASEFTPEYANLAYIARESGDSGPPRSTPENDRHLRGLYSHLGDAVARAGREFGDLALPDERRSEAERYVRAWKALGRGAGRQFALFASLDDPTGALPPGIGEQERRGTARVERLVDRVRDLSRGLGFEECGRGLFAGGVFGPVQGR